MKIDVKLTSDELMDVVDAAMDEAIDRGYDPDDDETVEDMLHIVDAALATLGIEIVEDEDAEDFDEDEDEEEEEDENPLSGLIYELEGKPVVSKADAFMILKAVKDIVYNDDRIPASMKADAAQSIFLNFCSDMGIWGVDNRD